VTGTATGEHRSAERVTASGSAPGGRLRTRPRAADGHRLGGCGPGVSRGRCEAVGAAV